MSVSVSAGERRRALVLGSLGGGLEFYDFVIYAVFADVIGQTFFPSGNAVANLLAAFTVFAIGYLARPFGGIVFSHFGDRFGRKGMLRLSIAGMAGATILMGLMPGYAQIGIAASIIFVLLRIVQGLSLGGEIPGAMVLITETMPERRGLACGFLFLMINIGLLLAHAVQWALVSGLDQAQILSFGWRIGFLVGGAIAFLGFVMRKRLSESPAFAEMESEAHKVPLAQLLQNNMKGVIAGVFITGLGAAIVSMFYLYFDTYATTLLKFPQAPIATASLVGIIVFSLPMPIAGWIADRTGRPKLPTLVASVLLLVTVVPLYMWIEKGAGNVMGAMLVLSVLAAFAWGPTPAVLTEVFPTDVRFSGVAFTYNLGFAVFGGLTPLVSTALIHWSGNMLWPAFILVVFLALGIVATAMVELKGR
ncbi:MFS transporter [Chachezhania sediminis]|uniref:MFS transporter n=1 Tax=Chachezhania sediminis TaxID=2599291 RepID=UPI00131C575C|nr:MFS transporter [Chachezhania sediminis]